MGYLVLNDYKTYIQGDYLRQLTQADPERRIAAEKQAMQDIIQRLTQKYDLSLEFTETKPWDKDKTYGVMDRATVAIGNGFSAWAASTSYTVGKGVIYNGYGYYCATANSDATFTPSKWTLVAAENTIFHVKFPDTCTLQGQPHPATLTDPYAPMFYIKNIYKKDDVVYWRGNTWVCNRDSLVVDHQAALQFVTTNNIPYANVFPDDALANAHYGYWKDPEVYVIEPGKPLTNTEAWAEGDNRNQTIKASMVAMTVFRLSPLIAPLNRPQSWLEDYRGYMSDLKEAGLGTMTMVLPPRQPPQGLKTRYGSDIKNSNNF